MRITGRFISYAGTIFLSAFLLFAIQPIASKHLLPYFGGSSSVWATSLLFFTAVLFIGYAYVYVLTGLQSRLQKIIHALIVGVALLTMLGTYALSGSVFPDLSWIPGGTIDPAIAVLLALAASVGIPYFVLSTSGPLLQYWYGVYDGVEPYGLYALSNAGSLIALLSYPFVIEPLSSLPIQHGLWIVLFAAYAIALFLIIRRVQTAPSERRGRVGALQTLQWIGLSALPSFLLVAVTTAVTQFITPVPLLWVVPLSLYLVTLILAFSGRGQSIYVPALTLIAAFLAYRFTPATPTAIVEHVGSDLALLFFASLMCHARLYELRPPHATLPYYYVHTSLGGMLGALSGSIVAPLLFNDFWEFPLALSISAALAGYMLSPEFFPRIHPANLRLVKIAFPFFIALLFTNMVTASIDASNVTSRNFYGTVHLGFQDDVVMLKHGTTLHGMQSISREWAYVPSTYYVQSSGLGRAMQYVQRDRKPVRVGVIGLGTGAISAYCDGGDTFTFFEIDPRIAHIAETYFSYLQHCKGSSVKIGDGRLSLQKENAAGAPAYDLIAVDAFTDDTIPAHLLTKEAVELYLDMVDETRGVVAIHVSNRYLDLAPMLLSVTRELGAGAMVVHDNGENDGGFRGTSTLWVLIAKNPRIFDDVAFSGVAAWTPPKQLPRAWSDSYTSIWSVLNVPLPW